jgi:hypothetical protein
MFTQAKPPASQSGLAPFPLISGHRAKLHHTSRSAPQRAGPGDAGEYETGTLMGFFGAYLFDGSRWTLHQPDQLPAVAEPWLMIDIHDSDITTVVYRPAGRGSGVAYLGVTPRTYFEDEGASPPTDVAREAAGLVDWWAQRRAGLGEITRATKESELATCLAEDVDPAEIDLEEDEDVDELDDAEIFVEIKTARFLTLLDLPVPEDLSG